MEWYLAVGCYLITKSKHIVEDVVYGLCALSRSTDFTLNTVIHLLKLLQAAYNDEADQS